MISKFFNSKKIMQVVENKNGVVTYCNMTRLKMFNEAYRNQLKAFLQGALGELTSLEKRKGTVVLRNKNNEKSMGELVD